MTLQLYRVVGRKRWVHLPPVSIGDYGVYFVQPDLGVTKEDHLVLFQLGLLANRSTHGDGRRIVVSAAL
jgi:hypothetical protein